MHPGIGAVGVSRGGPIFALIGVLCLLQGCGADEASPTPKLQLSVLSSAPDKVTGDDALVQVSVLDSPSDAAVTIKANGIDVSSQFQKVGADRWVGRVSGLQPGTNDISVNRGVESAKLALTAYPISGPVISGPPQTPFVCASNFPMPTGVPALATIAGDANCSVQTRIDYLYRTTAGAYVYLPDPQNLKALLMHLAN